MKKFILFIFVVQSVACSLWAATPSIVSGVWNREPKMIALYQVVSGRLETLCLYNLQEDKTFGFAFNVPQEGFYAIGTGSPLSMQDKYVFYFKPEDHLSVEINDSTYQLTGKNTEENVALAHWSQYLEPLAALNTARGNITYEDYFPLLQKYLSASYTPLPTDNPVFNQTFEQYRTIDFVNIATNLLVMPSTKYPAKEDYPGFYRNMDIPALTQDGFLLSYPFGSSLLSRLFIVKYVIGESSGPLLDEMLAEITDDALKGEIVLQEAVRLKSYDGYLNLMKKYEQYIILPDQKKRASEIAIPLASKENQPNQPGIDFTCKDVNGKEVSLSDFKGKMVYVDVWATWCGPCIKEMPHIEKLMEEYKGKDIVFMGVSIDKEKDKPKWQNFLKEKKLKGVQVYAGQGSELAKIYQIATIPRFMLFDKKGNIVSTDAPRPSEPEVRLMIDKGLKE